MAIDWGGWSGHLRIGLEVTFSPSSPSTNTTSVDMTLEVYVGTDGFNFADNQTVNLSGTSSASIDFFNDLSSGYKKVYQRTWTNLSISYGGGPTHSWSASLSGAYNGASPSNSISRSRPARPADVPDKVGTPTVTEVFAKSARLDWSPPSSNGSSIDRYQVQVDNNTNWFEPYYNNGDVSGSAVLATGLPRNSGLYARVRAHNGVGWGPWSNARSLHTKPELPDKAVTAESDTTSPTSSSIRIKGTVADNGGAAIFDWDFRASRFSDFREFTPKNGDVGDGGGNSNGATFTGLNRATTYYFTSSAQNTAGTGPVSNTFSLATLPTVPDRPDTPNVSNITSNRVEVGYGTLPNNGGSAFTKWQMQYWVTNQYDATQVIVDDTTNPTTPQPINGLDRATDYSIRTRAVNDVGPSDWSPTVAFRTAATVPDAGPSPVVSVVSQAEVRVQISIPISGGSPVTGYDIQWSTDNFASQAGLISNTQSRDLVVGGLQPSTIYKFRYRGINAIGAGEWSPASSSEETLSGGQAKVAGNWRNIRSRAKVAGAWRDLKTHKKVAGIWRL